MNRTLLYQSVRNGLQVRFPSQAMPSRHCIAQACAVEETPPVPPPALLQLLADPDWQPELTLGEPFSYLPVTVGGTPPVAYSLAGDPVLPVGIEFDPLTGEIFSLDAPEAVITVSINAIDSLGQRASLVDLLFEIVGT